MDGETKGVGPKQSTHGGGSDKPKAVSKMGGRVVKKQVPAKRDVSLATEVQFVAHLLRKEVKSLPERNFTKGRHEN